MLDKATILSATQNGLSVFKHYIPIDFKLGKNFKNPFYDDKNASCNIYYDRHNQLFKIKDFGNPDYSGDCFAFVAQITGMDVRRNFLEVLQLINRDLNLHLEEKEHHYTTHSKRNTPIKSISSITKTTNEITDKTPKPFHFTEKSFTSKELQYWKQYGISEKTLDYYDVKSLSEFRSVNNEGNNYELQSTESEPLYGYPGEDYIKLYRPKSKLRFLYGGEIPEKYCFGLNKLPNRGGILFITGGEKDVMSLYAKGYHAICFNSETSHIPSEIIEMLKHRFKHIILLYDSDKTGLEASERHQEALKQYGVKRLLLPQSGSKSDKDISDYFARGKSREDLELHILNLLKSTYNQTMTLLRTCEVDLAHPPRTISSIVSVNEVPIGTQGNLLCITGGEGTGKSNYASAIISGTIVDEDFEADTLGLTINPNTTGKAVLLYDTEQSENQIYKNTLLMLKRANKSFIPDWLKIYYLTAMSRKERLQAIQDSMDYYFYLYSGIHVVIIDGIADLIRSANDEIESIAIVEELYRLAGIYRTCIIGVLHFVPNSYKLRGHLGSELQRKAAAILSIEKDTQNPEISVVKTLKVRDGSPLDVPLMQFGWDKQKGMHVYKGEKSPNEKEKRKETDLGWIAKEVFSKNRRLSYLDLAAEIESLMDVKERTAKNYIRYMSDKKIIGKDEISSLYYLSGGVQ